MKYYTKRISTMFLMFVALLFLAGSYTVSAQNKSNENYSWLNLDTVKAGKFDTGKMWTFDYPPINYFEKEYNFKPSEEWLENVRMSALRFANYCTASFVSADGLVMTNHHCGRQSISEVTKPGEDLMDSGFVAKTLADERPVPGLYVEQLVLIKDVTNEIQAAADKGTTPAAKADSTKSAIREMEESQSKATGLRCSVVTLFNGGKYSLYGYKRYSDVRLVFAPEEQAAYFGGDPDNFTYPRYDVDCSFFRVYDENGNPLKTEHYFKWSPDGAKEGEPVFVVGNPGRTSRLNTVSQLEFTRDITYPYTLELLGGIIDVYKTLLKEHPERQAELQNTIFYLSNSQKAITGYLGGLRDPILMQKKKDFENTFKKAVLSNPSLNAKYGDIWSKISDNRMQLRSFAKELYGLSVNPRFSSEYFGIAQDVVDLANELKKPEDQRSDEYKGAELDSTVAKLFPENFDAEKNKLLLQLTVNNMIENLGANNEMVMKFTGGNTGEAAVDYALSHSSLTSADKIKDLVDKGADAILNSDDPFIYFTIHSKAKRDELQKKSKELSAQEATYNQELGRALFEVYGTSIPPDATFTLRLQDGVVKGYDYNGTEAPPFTTFYGIYNRHYSFGDRKDWAFASDRWKNPPADFNLATHLDMVSTNDIIGGNSGSAVINEKAQVVGLAFDGNIESLPGDFIYDTKTNRAVSVTSNALMQVIRYLFNDTRIADELQNGMIK
jgi:hypothetical protein